MVILLWVGEAGEVGVALLDFYHESHMSQYILIKALNSVAANGPLTHTTCIERESVCADWYRLPRSYNN